MNKILNFLIIFLIIANVVLIIKAPTPKGGAMQQPSIPKRYIQRWNIVNNSIRDEAINVTFKNATVRKIVNGVNLNISTYYSEYYNSCNETINKKLEPEGVIVVKIDMISTNSTMFSFMNMSTKNIELLEEVKNNNIPIYGTAYCNPTAIQL